MTAPYLRSALSLIGACVFLQAAVAQIDVTTQHNDLARTGTNLQETVLTPGNVSATRFGILFKHVLDDQSYSQPLLVSKVDMRGGTRDVIYLTTVNNSVYAFDANDGSQTAPLWHVNFGTPANLHDAAFGCPDINGKMGIIGTPVIALKKNGAAADALYVVSLTRIGRRFEQRLHALDLATGADLENSPTTIRVPGFDPLMQSQRPALALANGVVYIGYASHCDKLPYHGFLLSYDSATLAQRDVFNASPTGTGASIWHSGQAPAVDDEGNVYVATGNGTWDGVSNFSESFIKLDANLRMLDWFTPSNHEMLDQMDMDLNSSGVTLIPGSHLMIGGGKEGILYTSDTDKLGHFGDASSLQHFPATTSHLHSLVIWNRAARGTLIYVWGQRDRARVYQMVNSRINQTPVMVRAEVNEGHPGAMLSLSADGDRDGILWAAIHATGDSWHESRPGVLHAYDAVNIEHELWNSLELRGRDDCGNFSKMAPPTIANGKVYLASFGSRNVGTGQLCVYGLLANGAPPVKPELVKVLLVDEEVRLSWSAVDDAQFYSVQKTRNSKTTTIDSGLTSPFLFGVPAELGTTNFTVTAWNSNGAGEASTAVSIAVQTPTERERVMMKH